ncbi:MAG: stage III sporulation protein AF [Syntrophomonadaceae bacterium]|jgi:stage III sporulation protein AF|nr:stage III sporulation protein AF [Syntrophomonadaceae bacterium]
MSVLTEIVRNILVIIIMASFLELLLPEGAIRPFVRFAIGLFVLIAVLNPVLGYFFDDSNFQITWWDYQMEAVEEESLLRRGQEINQNIMNHNQSLLKEKLEGQINAVVLLVPGVETVETEAFISGGGIEKLSFRISEEQADIGEDEPGVWLGESGDEQLKEQIEKKVRAVVINMYGLREEQIEISFEGGK